MHRFDPISFAFGLLFVAVAVIALFDLPADLGRWLLPLGVLGLGSALAYSALAPGRSQAK